MSTKHSNEHPANTVDDLPRGRPPSHPSVRGPQSASSSPMDSSPLLEVNYVKCLFTQNSMDVKFDSTHDLANQRSWADQADDRTSFSQSNMPSNQNEVNIPDPTAHPTGTNLAATSVNLESSAIL